MGLIPLLLLLLKVPLMCPACALLLPSLLLLLPSMPESP